MNFQIPDAINQWSIDHDPYEFIKTSDWLDLANKVEDILQISHVYADGPIIDVGYYSDNFVAQVIAHNNWVEPIEKFVSHDTNKINRWLHTMLKKYENGL